MPLFLAPTRSSRKANVRSFVRSFVRVFGSSLSRAINLHNFGSNFQADFKGLSQLSLSSLSALPQFSLSSLLALS